MQVIAAYKYVGGGLDFLSLPPYWTFVALAMNEGEAEKMEEMTEKEKRNARTPTGAHKYTETTTEKII